MASGQRTPLANWYPGDDLADVVSSDYSQSQNDYNTMKQIGTNKVLGIAETWLELNPASDPPFSYSVVWASRDWAQSGPGTQGVQNA
jgi:hypothetical protein